MVLTMFKEIKDVTDAVTEVVVDMLTPTQTINTFEAFPKLGLKPMTPIIEREYNARKAEILYTEPNVPTTLVQHFPFTIDNFKAKKFYNVCRVELSSARFREEDMIEHQSDIIDFFVDTYNMEIAEDLEIINCGKINTLIREKFDKLKDDILSKPLDKLTELMFAKTVMGQTLVEDIKSFGKIKTTAQEFFISDGESFNDFLKDTYSISLLDIIPKHIQGYMETYLRFIYLNQQLNFFDFVDKHYNQHDVLKTLPLRSLEPMITKQFPQTLYVFEIVAKGLSVEEKTKIAADLTTAIKNRLYTMFSVTINDTIIIKFYANKVSESNILKMGETLAKSFIQEDMIVRLDTKYYNYVYDNKKIEDFIVPEVETMLMNFQ